MLERELPRRGLAEDASSQPKLGRDKPVSLCQAPHLNRQACGTATCSQTNRKCGTGVYNYSEERYLQLWL